MTKVAPAVISLLLGLTLCSLTYASGPAARPSASVQATVNAYLSTLDTPISAQRWKALGEEGVAALADIARSQEALPSRRARAVGAAGVIGGEQAKALALELARKDPASVVRQSAVRALGQLLSASELAAILTPLLDADPSLGVRAVAANVLSERTPASCDAIRTRVQQEPASRQPAFSSALGRCASKQ